MWLLRRNECGMPKCHLLWSAKLTWNSSMIVISIQFLIIQITYFYLRNFKHYFWIVFLLSVLFLWFVSIFQIADLCNNCKRNEAVSRNMTAELSEVPRFGRVGRVCQICFQERKTKTKVKELPVYQWIIGGQYLAFESKIILRIILLFL